MGQATRVSELQVRTLQAVWQRQRALASGLSRRAADIREAASGRRRVWPYVEELVDFVAGQVLPYASAEEETIYAAARAQRQLQAPVTGMVSEHEHLASLFSRLADATRLVAATEQAGSLASAFSSHLAEETSLLPKLLEGTDIDPAPFVARMDSLARRSWASAALDLRGLEPGPRQRAVFERFEGLPPGGSFGLLGDTPLEPVRYRLEARHGGEVTWELLEAGPPLWRARVGSKVSRRPGAQGHSRAGAPRS